MRELYKDQRGVVRFKPNAIVNWLVDTGRVSLNDIVENQPPGGWPVEDQEEFWQMINYSVGGYGDLSFIRPETIDDAYEAMNRLVHPEDYLEGGMSNPIGR